MRDFELPEAAVAQGGGGGGGRGGDKDHDVGFRVSVLALGV